jgi:glutamate/tyrosine decarboxylase-like PLP-dependent enzyme
VVVPDTAHPAFNKGAHYLGMEVVRVPVTQALVGDPGRMAEAITDDTVMMVGSAPCFPFGVTDPIAELAEVAAARGLWLHVDACVGGYIAPFIRLLDEPVPAYDFSIDGVCSMSADLHKYGYAAKGASTVLYRDTSMRDYQGFHFDQWACGHMYTPTMAGTRPGGAIAAAWAVMNYLGVEGYKARARQIVDTRKRLEAALDELGLEVLGDPKLSLIAFGGSEVDILAVGDGLYQAGWLSSRTNNPPGIHLMISPMHERIIEEYITLLAGLVARARSGELGKGSTDISYA